MIRCENLVKIYKTKDSEVVALQGLDLKVKSNEFIAIIGNSGSGKSTLLNMLGGLDKPSAGKLIIDGKNLLLFNQKELCMYRRNTVGFVWQNSARNLIPYLTAIENIKLPMLFTSNKEKDSWANKLLEIVELYHRKDHYLFELSGGEQQRIALAISLANKPKILLADEPTGSIDEKTTDNILNMFHHFNKELHITIIIVTHDRQVSKHVDRVVQIRDGKVSSEFLRKSSFKNLKNMSKKQYNLEDSHVEMVVLDKAGRLQLPKDILDKLKKDKINKLIVEQDGEKIILKK